jgi:EREBP-like factor
MYRGVYQTSWGNTWQAVIQKNGKRHYLGAFKNEESAARAYDRAALSLYGSTATLNFPTVGEEHPQTSLNTQRTS